MHKARGLVGKCPFTAGVEFHHPLKLGDIILYMFAGRNTGKQKNSHTNVTVLMVEHRGFEPLTSTLRTLRATNCANAP